MDKKEFCIFVDAGHGGINPKVKLPNGYTTFPSKCSQHNNGKFHTQKLKTKNIQIDIYLLEYVVLIWLNKY